MAAPAYAAAGTLGSTATKDSSLTPAWPGGSATAGHLAICQVAISDQGSGHTPPSFVETSLQGFRRLGPSLTASGFANTRSSQMRLYYKVLAGSDTAPSFQMTGGTGSGPLLGAVISTYSGDVGAIRLSTGNVGDAGTITGTGITTKAAGGLVAAYSSVSDDAALASQAFTDPASPTERYDLEVAARMGVHLATGIRATAGASGNFTATPDEIDPWCVMVLALEETETFPSEAVLEPFTYSDGELDTVSGGDWVDDTFNFANDGLTVASNQANNSSANDERSYYDAAQAQGDGEVAVTVATLPATSERVMLGYRIQAPDTAGVDGYELVHERKAAEDDWILYRVDNGSYTPILDVDCDIVAGDVIGVAYSGSVHDLFIKPASGPRIQVGSVSEGTYTAEGYVALGIKGTTARLDDFIAGPMVEVATPHLPISVVSTLGGQISFAEVLPGAMTSAYTLTVTAGAPISPALVTFDGADVSIPISSSVTAGLATFAASAVTALHSPVTAAGLVTFDGEDLEATGDFPNPIGRNRYDVQLVSAGAGSGRSATGTPGSAGGRS